METVTETLKNDATSDAGNYIQVTIAHDNQQKLIKDTHAQLAVELRAQIKEVDERKSMTTAERDASVGQKQCRPTEHLDWVDKPECGNRMFDLYETCFKKELMLESNHKP